MKKLVIVDGSSILSSCFFATVPNEYYRAKSPEERQFILPRIMQHNGVFTNGVFAMCRSLNKLVEKQKPTHLAVAWDISRNTFRRKLYPDYKANRDETVPELKSQYILMQDILRSAGIAQFMDENLEADDFLGSLSKIFESEIPIFLYTKDQDALQLVSDRTRLWLITSKSDDLKREFKQEGNIPDGAFEFTPLLVKEIYGLYPSQIIDKKALEGDSSDNIPGVRGVGEKASVPLLQELGTVEAIFEALEDEISFKNLCKDLGIRSPIKALQGGKESAMLSKDLATIRCQDMNTTLHNLRLQVNQDALNQKFAELNFKSLVKAVPVKTAVQDCLAL
ncbi:5'-3' exonuclease H3TH domain-containing protein [Bacteroides sp.]|uniref:5'-3' exonuclease n=1 Tax=Bacteroides sp. TaxID=29523 RepID=UPI0026322A31|nr:5'-3' exonuclease H3TH domain-containing protein [Bacteroides sp.]MDD3040420.1 5'-3' exonuclease H3TH domain-containing protein [Bacteroides sp.]